MGVACKSAANGWVVTTGEGSWATHEALYYSISEISSSLVPDFWPGLLIYLIFLPGFSLE